MPQGLCLLLKPPESLSLHFIAYIHISHSLASSKLALKCLLTKGTHSKKLFYKKSILNFSLTSLYLSSQHSSTEDIKYQFFINLF